MIAAALLALPLVGSSAATAARRTGPRPAACLDAAGARWHIRHYFFRYDSHGAVLSDAAKLPASGHRYIVNAGGTDCALAHKLMPRLTSATPDRALTGRRVKGYFVPPGYGYLFQSPRGISALQRSTTPIRDSSTATTVILATAPI